MRKSMRKLTNQVIAHEQRQQPYSEYIDEAYGVCDGMANIYVELEKGGLYDPLSPSAHRALNPEIYRYIDEKIAMLPYGYGVNLCFSGPDLTGQEQGEVARLLTAHYNTVLHDKHIDLKVNAIKTGGLAALGLVTLSIYFLPIFSRIAEIFAEILSVVGSFALWQATDFFLLERKAMRAEWLNAGQTALARVQFVKNHEKTAQR